MADTQAKAGQLKGLYSAVSSCDRCELGKSRTNLVFGDGDAEAKLMFVGEAPGYHEDLQGIPFVGRAGQLLAQLLGRIGLAREQVYIANVLKCRPPDNRDPLQDEITACREFLEQQIAIIEPAVICTLGNFSTKLLTGKPDGISRVHGRPQPYPGRENTCIFPVFHPAAALYTPSNLKSLEADFDRLPKLLGRGEQETQVQVEPSHQRPEVIVEVAKGEADPEQLGLF